MVREFSSGRTHSTLQKISRRRSPKMVPPTPTMVLEFCRGARGYGVPKKREVARREAATRPCLVSTQLCPLPATRSVWNLAPGWVCNSKVTEGFTATVHTVAVPGRPPSWAKLHSRPWRRQRLLSPQQPRGRCSGPGGGRASYGLPEASESLVSRWNF